MATGFARSVTKGTGCDARLSDPFESGTPKEDPRAYRGSADQYLLFPRYTRPDGRPLSERMLRVQDGCQESLAVLVPEDLVAVFGGFAGQFKRDRRDAERFTGVGAQ